MNITHYLSFDFSNNFVVDKDIQSLKLLFLKLK